MVSSISLQQKISLDDYEKDNISEPYTFIAYHNFVLNWVLQINLSHGITFRNFVTWHQTYTCVKWAIMCGKKWSIA